MKAMLFLVCGIVLANIVAATFIWPPSTTASGKPAPVVNSATRQGQDPWMVNERYNAPYREQVHKGTLETLDKPWASYCTTEGHGFLIRSIDNYYWQRNAQVWSYGHTYGEDARRYAVKAWTTTDDNRIQRLIVRPTAAAISRSTSYKPTHARRWLNRSRASASAPGPARAERATNLAEPPLLKPT